MRLAAGYLKRTALDRLLAMAPALEAAGSTPLSEDEIAAEVETAVRSAGRGKQRRDLMRIHNPIPLKGK